MTEPAPTPAPPRGALVRLYPLWAALLAIVLGALAMWRDARKPDAALPLGDVDVEAFVQPGCRHCEAAKAFLHALAAERPGLSVVERDVGRDRDALERLRALATRAGAKAAGTPSLYVRGTLIVGWRDAETTGARVRTLLATGAAPADKPAPEEGQCPVSLEDEDRRPPPGGPAPCASDAPAHSDDDVVRVPIVGRVRARDVGLPLFTLVIGLVDGFNPCAMWVLLFLLSLLVNLKSRAKMLAIAGTFVFASGLCYFAFMAAWLTFFDLVGETRLVQVVLGAGALFVGAIHTKDFFAFHEGLTLSIPESKKPGLYARVTAILRHNRLAGAMLGVVVLAFLVNTVELLCTAGLPALYTGVLSRYDLPRWQHYAYLAFYQVFYMLDDTIMLVIAIVTLSRHRLQETGGRWLKLVSGAVIVAVGVLLLFRPEWLYW